MKGLSSRVKNVALVLGICLIVLFGALGAQKVTADNEVAYSTRYVQHLEMEEPDPETELPGAFNTKLPIVSIETGGQKIPGTAILNKEGHTIGYETADDGGTTVLASISIVDEAGVYHQPQGEASLNAQARIRIRGNTSRLFDKKSYKLNFVDGQGLEKDVDVMGMGVHDEWALYGPFLDKTLLRNYVILNLYGKLEDGTPDVRYCEVFLDGSYQGLYVMMETIAAGNARVNIAASDTRKDKSSYIVRLDKEWSGPEEFISFSYYTLNLEPDTVLSVVYPGTSNLSEDFYDYIKEDFSAFEKALYSYDFNDENRGYRELIDVQSFVDYYIISEFFLINDMCSRSTYLYKDLGGKLCMGPGWDFNNAADNFIMEVMGNDGTGFNYTDRTWYKMLLKDEYFVEQVIETYREMREDGGILEEDALMDTIDETVDFLGEAIDRNYQVWGYSFDPEKVNVNNKLRPVERNPENYEEALDQLKDFLHDRGDWLDEHMDSLVQYCDSSKVKQYLD